MNPFNLRNLYFHKKGNCKGDFSSVHDKTTK
jgi:hypothetical protein